MDALPPARQPPISPLKACAASILGFGSELGLPRSSCPFELVNQPQARPPEAESRHPHPGGGNRRRRPHVADLPTCLPPGTQPNSTTSEYGPRYHRSPQTAARIPHRSEVPTLDCSRLTYPAPTSPQVTASDHSARAPRPRFRQPWCAQLPRLRPLTGILPGQGRFFTWRVMDSNQRRTTPTVLQRNTATTLTCGDAPSAGVRSGVGHVASSHRDDPPTDTPRRPRAEAAPDAPGPILRHQHQLPGPAPREDS
jgi:hypothetical protein